MEEVPVIISSGSFQLQGIYHICKNSPNVVLLCPGLGGTRVDVHRINVLLARELVQYGYNCLRVDFTGAGISGGSLIDASITQQKKDILSCLDWLTGEREQQNIYLLGFSDGAVMALNTGMNNPQVKGVILWSPNVVQGSESTHNNRLYRVGSQLAWPILGHWVHKDYFSDRAKEICSIDYSELNKPVLMICGQEDHEIYNSLRQINHPLIMKHVIKDANHLYFSYEWTQQVIKGTVQWLSDQAIGEIR